jgi:hypothetical protein
MRTAARTAVIAGTATAVSGRVARRQQARDVQAADAQAYQMQQQEPAPAPPPPPAGGLSANALDELKQLAELHSQGVLTDEEFATQKARILA